MGQKSAEQILQNDLKNVKIPVTSTNTEQNQMSTALHSMSESQAKSIWEEYYMRI